MKEIERKYLVTGDTWRESASGIICRQGYLSTVRERVVRVRTLGAKGYLTIKGVTRCITRLEFEYTIPKEEADTMLNNLCERPLIEKTRYSIDFEGLTWEVDEFGGENKGLIVAEVELGDENQAIGLPEWIGKEVSEDSRYFNSNLVKKPYTKW